MKLHLPAELARVLGGFSFQPVTVGMSNAGVWRAQKVPSGTHYSRDIVSDTVFLKVAKASSDPDPGFSVRAEAEKLVWMHSKGIRVAEVIKYFEQDGLGYLVTTAVPGVDATHPWALNDIPAVVDALADALRDLHAVPIESCPFDQCVERKIDQARQWLECGLVDEDDFDDERQGATARELYEQLLERRPQYEDLVFCHGDYCIPNVLLEQIGTRFQAGFVDVGRAGVADRWQDLALMTRSLESDDLNPQLNGLSERFLERYGIEPDPERIAFYRLLDEFF
jgi:aminoglycoside phosphotransferase